MLEKVSIQQSLIDYEVEQKLEELEAKNYYMLLVNRFGTKNCAIYEDAVIETVGEHGLTLLRKYKLIESCAVIKYRKLYAL